MSDFKGVTERFRVTMVNSDGQSERVTVQVSLEGLKILNSEGTRTMRSYDFKSINRCSHENGRLIVYTKSPVDIEERQLELTADSRTISTTLDTIMSFAMQCVPSHGPVACTDSDPQPLSYPRCLCRSAELMASNAAAADREAATNLQALVAGGGKKKSSPSVSVTWVPAASPNSSCLSGWQGRGPGCSAWARKQMCIALCITHAHVRVPFRLPFCLPTSLRSHSLPSYLQPA
jgi:hypothetical protein